MKRIISCLVDEDVGVGGDADDRQVFRELVQQRRRLALEERPLLAVGREEVFDVPAGQRVSATQSSGKDVRARA